MPKLYDWLVTGLNETNLTISEAIKHSGFSLVDRQRLKNWQANFNDQIDTARDLILPGGEAGKGATRTKKGKAQSTAEPADTSA